MVVPIELVVISKVNYWQLIPLVTINTEHVQLVDWLEKVAYDALLGCLELVGLPPFRVGHCSSTEVNHKSTMN